MIRFLYRRFVIDCGNAVVGELVYVSYSIAFRSLFYLYDVHSFDIAHLHEAHTNLLIVP